MDKKGKMFAGCLLAEGLLWFIDNIYADILNDAWYLMIGIICFIWYFYQKQLAKSILCIIICVSLLALFFTQLPRYTYRQAVDMICQEEECAKENLVSLRAYQGLFWNYENVSKKNANYLIAFNDNNETLYYVFNPYLGTYIKTDVSSEFPFLEDNLIGSS